MRDIRKKNIERKKKEYWIDTSGNIHRFKGDLKGEYTSFHSEIARQIHPDSTRPGDILMNLGWIMVGSTVYSCPIINKEPTQSQIDVLFDLDLYKYLLILDNNYYVNFKQKQIHE